MFHSRPEMLAGTMEDQRGQDGQVTCLGPRGSSRTPGHLPRAGCQDSLWDSCILEWPTLADRQAGPTTQPLPASPSLRGPYAGGFWIHNSALVPIFKRQMQFFFCSILIAKMFNFQTFVFPGKCFRNRNIPS